MEMTLNQYLAEVDRWKQPVSERTAATPVARRAEMDREARAWLEKRLGRALRTAPEAESRKPRPT